MLVCCSHTTLLCHRSFSFFFKLTKHAQSLRGLTSAAYVCDDCCCISHLKQECPNNGQPHPCGGVFRNNDWFQGFSDWMWFSNDSGFFPIPACSHLCLRRRFPRLYVSRHCMDQVQPKMLTKHVFRLMEKFNIAQGVCVCVYVRQCVRERQGFCLPRRQLTWAESVNSVWPHVFHAGLCPNALRKRRLDTLRFLMYSRFVEVRVAKGFICYLNSTSLLWDTVSLSLYFSSTYKHNPFPFSFTPID